MRFWPTGASISDAVTGEEWDNQRLEEEVQKRASLLQGIGVGPDTRVMVSHGGSPNFFADLFAIWSLGGCAICLDPGLTDTEITNIRNLLSPSLFLVDDAFTGGAGLELPILCSQKETQHFSATEIPKPQGDLDSPALILLTSGTTGTPKGVSLSIPLHRPALRQRRPT